MSYNEFLLSECALSGTYKAQMKLEALENKANNTVASY